MNAAPTPVNRAVTYERDGERCISCGRSTGLQIQHRRRVGAGGSKIRPRLDDLVTSCGICNDAYEHMLQNAALRFGWKVRAWVQDPSRVPVFYPFQLTWYVLSADGGRRQITAEEATQMMRDVYGAEDYQSLWEVVEDDHDDLEAIEV